MLLGHNYEARWGNITGSKLQSWTNKQFTYDSDAKISQLFIGGMLLFYKVYYIIFCNFINKRKFVVNKYFFLFF